MYLPVVRKRVCTNTTKYSSSVRKSKEDGKGCWVGLIGTVETNIRV